MTQTSQPRPLNAEERSLIEFLLSVDFPGRDELRRQLDAVEVVGGCDCGCGSLDLKVGGPAMSSQSESPIPVKAYNDAVEVLFFVRGDLLSYLEFVFMQDTGPMSLPKPSELQLWVRPPGKRKGRPDNLN